MNPETKTIAMIQNLHFTRSLTRSLAIAALAIFMFLPGMGWGQVQLAAWTFETADIPAAPNTPNNVAANLGTQSGTAFLYANGTNGSSTWITATTGNELTAFGGSIINDPRGGSAVAGNSYCPIGGTAFSSNGKSMVIKFSMTGFQDPILTFATRYSSATAYTTHQWAWSIDGTNFTNFGSNTAPTSTSFVTKTLDLSSINSVDGIGTVYLRITFSGITSTTSNNRLDNFVINATVAATSPTMTTNATPIALSATSATLGGNVTATGGDPISANGIVYSLTSANATPAISGSGVTQLANPSPGVGTGAFSLSTTVALDVNSQYSYRAYATNTIGTSYGGASGTTFYTYANVPSAPTVNNPTLTTLDATIGSSDGNPATTTYAIRVNPGLYVQADGTLGASAVWQTAAAWGTITVTGLSSATTYTFDVKARNGASVETAFGTPANGTTSTPVTPTANLSATPSLTEANLNGGTFSIILLNDAFNTTGSLATSDFTLNNAPVGVSISGVEASTTTDATVTLSFSGADFDADATTFNITIAAAQLFSAADLTSSNLVIAAYNETIAITGEPVTLTDFPGTPVNTQGATERTYDITATQLTGNLVITAPSQFVVSKTTASGFGSSVSYTPDGSGNIASSTVYVRFAPTALGATGSQTITNASTNATTKNVTASGTGISPSDPATFTATASSSTQINLAATANSNADNIVVVYNATGTFTTPSDGVAAGNAGDAFAGGTIWFKGAAGSLTSHTGLSSNQHVYYKTYSFDVLNFFSAGLTADATTLKDEPSSYETDLESTTGTPVYSAVLISWTDAIDGTVPDGYLIKGSSTSYAAILDPANGTPESDGGLVKNIPQGTEIYEFTGLTASTPYYFKVFPYTNSGTNISYKTDGTVPQTTVTTASLPWIEDFETGSKSAYAAANVTCTKGSWNMDQVLIGNTAQDRYFGSWGTRMYYNSTQPALRMNFDKTNGAGVVTIYHALYGSNSAGNWKLQMSINGGSTWTDVGSEVNTTSTTLSAANFTVNQGGNVRFKVIQITSGTRINIDNFTIADYTPPAPTIASFTPTSVCSGLSTTVTINGTNFYSTPTVQFNGIAATSVTLVSSTQITATSPTNATTGKITVTTPSGTGTSVDDFIVNPLPTASITPDGPTTFCAGGSVLLTASTGTSYLWSDASTASTLNATTSGSYTVTVTDGNGCFATSAPTVVTVNANVTPTFTQLGPYCVGATPDLLPTTSLNGIIGTWNPLTISTVASGTSTYTFTPEAGQCVSSATMDIHINGTPTAYAGTDHLVTKDQGYQITGSTATNYVSLSWAKTGGIGDGGFDDNTLLHPVFTGTADGPIELTLTVTGCSSTVTDMVTLYIVSSDPIEWLGGGGDDHWDNAENWFPSSVPSSTTNVLIPSGLSNYPTVYDARACQNITIQSGASLIANGNLTLSGTVTMEHPAISAGRWHFISSPVSGAVSGMFTGDYLYEYATGGTYTPILSISKSLDAMVGYALYPKTNPYTSAYVGGLNPTSNSFVVSGAGIDDQAGWNLVGNPYTSAIDWDATSGWTKPAVVDDATYIVNTTSSSWRSYVGGVESNGGSQYIAPTQGFFVHATGAGTLAMTNDVQVHNPVTFSKKSEAAVSNLVRVEVSGNEFKDEAVVRFTTEATPEFDGNYDALKLYGYVTEAAQLYTLGSIPLAINSLPETGQVPVGIKVGTNGSYTIAATEISDMPYVTLEDNETGIYTNLSDESYTFEAVAGTFDQRFILHFSMLSVEETKKASATVYSYQQTVHINMKEQVKGDIYIYNIAGQLVSTKRAAQGMNEIKLPNVGNYIVKVITKDNTVVRKVFIQ